MGMIKYGKFLCANQEHLYLIHALDKCIENKDYTPNLTYKADFIPDDFDFTIEPKESLKELYKKRAEELRKKYNYLILMYSGGSDSHEMLMSFLDNNIFIDEVRYFSYNTLTDRLDYDPPFDHPLGLMFEYHTSTVPGLRQVSLKSPHTKIVIDDYSKGFQENFTENWLDNVSKAHNVHGGLYFYIRNYLEAKSLATYCEKNALVNVGVLYGTDKPAPLIENNKIYIFFGNSNRGGIELFAYGDASRMEPVMFYWGEPRIPAKQIHLIKKWLEQEPKYKHLFLTDDAKFVKELNKKIYPSHRPVWQKHSKLSNEGIIETVFGEKARYLINLKNKHYNKKYGKIAGINRLTFLGSTKTSVMTYLHDKRYVGELKSQDWS